MVTFPAMVGVRCKIHLTAVAKVQVAIKVRLFTGADVTLRLSASRLAILRRLAAVAAATAMFGARIKIHLTAVFWLAIAILKAPNARRDDALSLGAAAIH